MNKEKQLRAFYGSCDDYDSSILVFAYTHSEAKKLAYKAYNDMFSSEYTEAKASLIKDKEILEYIEQYKTQEPSYDDNLPSCEKCFSWGRPIGKGDLCDKCRDNLNE